MGKRYNSRLGSTVRRELIRAVMERSQNMDVAKIMEDPVGAGSIRYDDVEENLNIAYINREEIPLAMDIFQPKIPKSAEMPVIVTIHGGGLTAGDRHISRPLARLLAHKGYLVFSIEYRLAPQADVSQQLDDVCAGLDFIGTHLIDYDVDFDRMFLVAESAGAFLALYVTAMKYSKKLQDAVGHQPSRFYFKAIGLNSGMFYTNCNDPTGWILAEQIYGKKRDDETFLRYMNPEDPEIIKNLPPVFLFTCRGDFMNNYSFKLNDALKKAGKECRFVYYPDEDLEHAFLTRQVDHPKTRDSIDKMLDWFEEQARLDEERRAADTEIAAKRRKVARRLSSGSIDRQNISSYIKERNSVDPVQMKATAIIDCAGEYTYEEMFAEWDRYAAVFSALGMTGKEGSRVGIAGTISAEPLFAFYGLNMTGACASMLSYPDFLPGGQWKNMVRKEKLTDLILSDIMVTPEILRELKENDDLGLRHVILIHSRLGGPTCGPAELLYDEFNYHWLKRNSGMRFMDDLLEQYGDGEISYSKADAKQIAVITHTSGTTKGMRKPLPYTNQAVNSVSTGLGNGFHSKRRTYRSDDQLRVAPGFDFSSFLCMCGLVNSYLAMTDTVVLTFFGAMHPKYVKAIDYYKLDIIPTSGFIMDKWMESRFMKDMDLSHVKVFACGGSYTPPDKVKKYNAFLAEHGAACKIYRGYGMSETGGAELYVPTGNEEDILGYPRPVENFRILDEADGKFYTADDGVRTGTMYVASDSLCCNTLDGEVLFEYTQIDGRDFICTNDMVRVNEDGSFSYSGRADNYFVNNDGVRFEAGQVETQMILQPGIDKCVVVPVLDKRIHDTVPILYIIAEKSACETEKAEEIARLALENLYTAGGPLEGTIMPSQFVLVDEIPCNANGKIDIFRITRERLEGKAYDIIPVREKAGAAADGSQSGEEGCAGNSTVVSVRIESAEQLSSITAGALPEGMEGNSAFDLFDLFNSAGADDPHGQGTFFDFRGQGKQREPFRMPDGLIRSFMKMQGRLYGQKDFDQYFEESTPER